MYRYDFLQLYFYLASSRLAACSASASNGEKGKKNNLPVLCLIIPHRPAPPAQVRAVFGSFFFSEKAKDVWEDEVWGRRKETQQNRDEEN